MFEGIDLNKINDLVSSFQEKSKQINEEARSKILELKAAGGLVKLKANAAGEVIDLDIDNELLEDKDSLQIVLIGLINDLVKNIEQNKQSIALNAMGNIGDMFKK